MAGEKNLDALIGRTDWKVKRTNGEGNPLNLIVSIDGADTTIIRDGVITQNGLELLAYWEQENDKSAEAYKEAKNAVIAQLRETGTEVPKPKTKDSKTIEGGSVQDGRRVPEVTVTPTETVGWQKVAAHESGISDAAKLKAHVKDNLPEYVRTGERVKLEIK